MGRTSVGKLFAQTNPLTLLLIGATLITWGMFLISFVLLYKGVF
jgi:hypothetical protein